MASLVVGHPKGMSSMADDHFKEIKGRREIFFVPNDLNRKSP
jgi:hypothetical protein